MTDENALGLMTPKYLGPIDFKKALGRMTPNALGRMTPNALGRMSEDPISKFRLS